MFAGFFQILGIGVCVAALLLRGVMALAMNIEGTSADYSRVMASMFCTAIFAIGLLFFYVGSAWF